MTEQPEIYGITRGGRSAEERYRSITGASVCSPPSAGDAILDGFKIELKTATHVLNQVRAVKYLTVVAFHPPSESWFVIPANRVVELISRKTRGQHTENPFECATISLRSILNFKVVSGTSLKEATEAAIQESENHPDIKQAMVETLRGCRQFADDSLFSVRKLFEEAS